MPMNAMPLAVGLPLPSTSTGKMFTRNQFVKTSLRRFVMAVPRFSASRLVSIGPMSFAWETWYKRYPVCLLIVLHSLQSLFLSDDALSVIFLASFQFALVGAI